MPNPMEVSADYVRDGFHVTDDMMQQQEDNAHPEVAAIRNASQSLVRDSSEDVIANWASKNGYKMSAETMDYLYNQYFNEKNTNSAWAKTLEADNTKYQRAIADIKAAGLNPIQVLSSSISGAGSASPGSLGSGSITAYKNQGRQSASQVGSGVITAIGSIIGALVIGLLAA